MLAQAGGVKRQGDAEPAVEPAVQPTATKIETVDHERKHHYKENGLLAPRIPDDTNVQVRAIGLGLSGETQDEQEEEDEDKDILWGKQARPYHEWGKGAAVDAYGKAWCAAYKVMMGADFLGEVVAEFLGLNQSKYQYVVDAYERHQRDLAQEQAQEEMFAKLETLNNAKHGDQELQTISTDGGVEEI